MTTKRITRPLLSISAWIVMQLILSLPANAQPQTFEFSYGSSTCVEKGFKGAEPVNECSGGGYIAVGVTSEQPDGPCTAEDHDDNVYVVRTNANGTRIWERVYDIGSLGGYDEGRVIRELPNGAGFIIAGTTRQSLPGATADIFLLKIDCNGNSFPTGFTQIYGSGNNVNDYASDLIIATIGDGITTNPGDFVISGWSERPFPNMSDGVLIRTRSNGTRVWDQTYNIIPLDPDQHDDYFHTLVEDQTAGTGLGDIIAAGHTTSFSFIGPTFFGTQGLVVRVNGNTGNIGPAPQGAFHYGGSQNDRFDAVEELVGSGDLIFAGSTTLPGVEDIYLVKTAAHPCTVLAQNTIDQAVVGSGEVALGIVQVLTTAGMPFCPIGHLALAGRTTKECPNPAPTGPYRHEEALLLHVDPFTLAAVAGRHFGSQMGCPRNEAFYSVMDVGNGDPGFILCGYTADNPGPIAPPPPIPDPSNLYLVKTDGNGETECAEVWNFFQQDPEWEETCNIPVQTTDRLRPSAFHTIPALKDHNEDVCPSNAPNGISPGQGAGIGGLDDEFDILESGSLSLPLSGKSETSAGDGTGKSATIRAKVRMKEE